jgi:type IV pilus assembly protein PilN
VRPIHLNLAARPYRDYKPVYAVVVVMSLLTAFLMLNNIDTYYKYVHETQNTRAQIGALESQARQERERDEATRRRLAAFDVARLDSQTRFINAKLAERAFSWSSLLDELESILADDVRLVSVAPAFDKNGNITLSLQLESKSADGMITTINRMNLDPRFANPFPTSETKQGETYSFGLTAIYHPEVRPASAVPARSVQR